ncbi:sensor histidine kinase [Aquibacillus rhizosphaerae]|uniref:histidine kinase n=1 Tax=Aquibacillus rhizosphaerae TaxID=3051431 RepID=A0ABT7L3X9_9BACI|nr:HAMP domain-containing sensor histidine kinase [Aquibacillus sp. LR5S19]MDL4840568.1 HAMP domain-containing sensor histidine kinase [Aquibacillus sp. LR5S19]
MNIHKRFIVQFFIQLILIFTLCSLLLLCVFAFLGFSEHRNEISKDISEASSAYLSSRITVADRKASFDDEFIALINNQNGWLLVLTQDGEVIGSHNTPEEIPEQFNKSELSTLLNKNQNTEYTYWQLDELDSKSPLVIFARDNKKTRILNEVKSEVDWKNHSLDLSTAMLQEIKKENGWIQLINSTGEVLDEYRAGKEPNQYSIQDILSFTINTESSVAVHTDYGTEQTMIVGTYSPNYNYTLEEDLFNTMNNSVLIIFLFLFLLLLIGTFWYARKFGVPLITMMRWVQNLGNGVYEQPHDNVQRPIMLNKKGKLKRNYRLYKDFVTTLSHLTDTLKENELQRSKITQTREEWISGISHDLKTPLASISGYAQMLESEKYTWNQAETRDFAKIIADKSIYMKQLLDDLTLTYRLKNQALPIIREKVDINDCLRRTIINFINDPANNNFEINFNPYFETILASIDPKWFQRIIDNLIANALKHNPAGTTVTISVSLIEKHLIVIVIEDNGIGMDKETLKNLFQRYYRGTNTNDSTMGTGLGMAITKQLIRLHGGSINVESKPDQGTTIRILLPT